MTDPRPGPSGPAAPTGPTVAGAPSRVGGPVRARPRLPRAHREVPVALGVFVVVLLTLQMFLLTVGLDALLADDDGLAWVTAALSVLLAAGSAAFHRYLR